MTESEVAIERAYAALDAAAKSLAMPRAEGPIWEGRAETPATVAKTVEQPAQRTQALGYVTDGSLRQIISGIAKHTGTAIKERDQRIADLEKRLTTLEALIARAKGSTQ